MNVPKHGDTASLPAWALVSGLPEDVGHPHCRLTLFALLAIADSRGRCIVTDEALRQVTGLTRPSLTRNLDLLIHRSFVSRKDFGYLLRGFRLAKAAGVWLNKNPVALSISEPAAQHLEN